MEHYREDNHPGMKHGPASEIWFFLHPPLMGSLVHDITITRESKARSKAWPSTELVSDPEENFW